MKFFLMNILLPVVLGVFGMILGEWLLSFIGSGRGDLFDKLEGINKKLTQVQLNQLGRGTV